VLPLCSERSCLEHHARSTHNNAGSGGAGDDRGVLCIRAAVPHVLSGAGGGWVDGIGGVGGFRLLVGRGCTHVEHNRTARYNLQHISRDHCKTGLQPPLPPPPKSPHTHNPEPHPPPPPTHTPSWCRPPATPARSGAPPGWRTNCGSARRPQTWRWRPRRRLGSCGCGSTATWQTTCRGSSRPRRFEVWRVGGCGVWVVGCGVRGSGGFVVW